MWIAYANNAIFQGVLNSLDYHRRRSPISGTVVSTSAVGGMYFAGRLDNDPDPDIISRSDVLDSNLATRATIFTPVDNEGIALMCFMGAGLEEVSTCQNRESQEQARGTRETKLERSVSADRLIFGPRV
ncbi:hypothetical protein EDD17DRAFT_1528773 [Pisolithus thermaeus]|nr:hypothetical protein EDD17DRAFT_1528773 [Pisolithus thermaeus]